MTGFNKYVDTYAGKGLPNSICPNGWELKSDEAIPLMRSIDEIDINYLKEVMCDKASY